MHDNILLPLEPAGVPGGRPNVDLGNVPIVMNVNEIRDGGIHALCCIGPASKEMTRHYFREPIVELMARDPEINLVGVVFVGSPQVNDEKTFVSRRLGAMADTMNVEGAIVTTEGFGNNHIDFASHIEELGKRGIKTVGVTYAAYQGQLVVGNPYMDAMIELNKDAGGFESERLGENTLTPNEARRALAMLKNKLTGVPIAAPENKWSQEVIDANQKMVDAAR
jgi:D-proline reductase (dithiol) PrdA